MTCLLFQKTPLFYSLGKLVGHSQITLIDRTFCSPRSSGGPGHFLVIFPVLGINDRWPGNTALQDSPITILAKQRKTRPAKRTQFLGREEAATNRIEHQGFVGLAGTPLKKNESSVVPPLRAVRIGGSSLCLSANAPTVMPIRNTATADKISMPRRRHENALLLGRLFRDIRARQSIQNSFDAGYLSIANSQSDPRFRPLSPRRGRMDRSRD